MRWWLWAYTKEHFGYVVWKAVWGKLSEDPVAEIEAFFKITDFSYPYFTVFHKSTPLCRLLHVYSPAISSSNIFNLLFKTSKFYLFCLWRSHLDGGAYSEQLTWEKSHVENIPKCPYSASFVCVIELSWMGENVSLSKQHETLACDYLPVTLALKFHMCNAYSKGHLKKKKKSHFFFFLTY